jgi:hypothetical protein
MIQEQSVIQESYASMKKLLIEENLEKTRLISRYNRFISICEEEFKLVVCDDGNVCLKNKKTTNDLVFEDKNKFILEKIHRMMDTKEDS